MDKIEEKLLKIWEKNSKVVGIKTINGEMYETYVMTNNLIKELSTLIQKEREEAVRGFVNVVCDFERDSDHYLYHLTYESLNKMIEAYLSQTKGGKE